MSDITVEADRFALALDDILRDVQQNVDEVVPVAARNSAKKGAAAVRRNARASFGGTGKYAKSWGYKSGKKGQESYAEIGSTMPGLPHLLEKGHATLGGGHVPGREHIANAAKDTFEDFENELSELIGGAL